MKNYYFTFGQNHWTVEGFPMKNSWVRVVAEDYETARSLFVANFSSLYMQTPETWAFQYGEEKFESHFYKNGEFAVITQVEPGRLESIMKITIESYGGSLQDNLMNTIIQWDEEAKKAMAVYGSEIDPKVREAYLYRAETYYSCRNDILKLLTNV